MPVYEFAIQTRREVTVGIAQHLGLDKPSPPKEQRGGEEEDWRKIFRMSLKHRDERGHEHEVAEWDERDLYAKGISMDTIVHGVELAACRDAAYQPYGEVVYVLAFHGKDHPNRSRFMFKIQGGQEVQNLAMTHGMMGGRDSVQSASLAERFDPGHPQVCRRQRGAPHETRDTFSRHDRQTARGPRRGDPAVHRSRDESHRDRAER